jgi:hypothetical protein
MSDRSADREGFDLAGIAAEAEVELVAAETIQITDVTPDVEELGYYEAELVSLRDAATTLGTAELLR